MDECKPLPTGGIVFYGNRNLLAKTGQQHTISFLRTMVDDYQTPGAYVPGAPIPVGLSGIRCFFCPNSLSLIPQIQPIMLGSCPVTPNYAHSDAQLSPAGPTFRLF